MDTIKSHRTQAQQCPFCHRMLDAATGIKGKAAPSAGDLNVCAYCGTMLRYGTGLRLEFLPFEDFMTLPADLRFKLKLISRLVRTDKFRTTLNPSPLPGQ